MTVHPTGEPVSSANYPVAEPLLLTIGRSGVLSCRAIAEKEFDTLLRLLVRPPNVSEATSSGPPISCSLRRNSHLLAPYRRTVRRPRLCDGTRASDARMSTATLKRELALLRSSLAALKPARPPRWTIPSLG